MFPPFSMTLYISLRQLPRLSKFLIPKQMVAALKVSSPKGIFSALALMYSGRGSPVTGQFPVFFYSDIQHPLRYIYSCRRNSVFVQGNGGVARSTRYVYDLEWSNARPFAFAPF